MQGINNQGVNAGDESIQEGASDKHPECGWLLRMLSTKVALIVFIGCVRAVSGPHGKPGPAAPVQRPVPVPVRSLPGPHRICMRFH